MCFMFRFRALTFALSFLFLLILPAPSFSQNASSSTPASASAAKTSNSAADIAAAKAAGKVWVNLDSGIYHKSGRWYGKTKNGKFMTEADARKAGYKASKRE